MNHEAPTPLSPAQRIRFSGMWEESGAERVAAAASVLRCSRPSQLQMDTDPLNRSGGPSSPAQRIKASRAPRAQSAGRSRSASRNRPASAGASRPPRPPPVDVPPEMPEFSEDLGEASVGSLAAWELSGSHHNLGFAFSQLLDTSQRLESSLRTSDSAPLSSHALPDRPVLSPSPNSPEWPEDPIQDPDAASDASSRETFVPSAAQVSRPRSAVGARTGAVAPQPHSDLRSAQAHSPRSPCISWCALCCCAVLRHSAVHSESEQCGEAAAEAHGGPEARAGMGWAARCGILEQSAYEGGCSQSDLHLDWERHGEEQPGAAYQWEASPVARSQEQNQAEAPMVR